MSENGSQINRKGDRWVDAIAAIVLITIFIVTALYWISSQG